MPNEINAIGQVDVRLSITFHRAPEVHTLLSMTNKRDRAKLIVEALRLYIEQTNHPAAKVETQLQSIASFLSQRKGCQPTIQDATVEVRTVTPEVRAGVTVKAEMSTPLKEGGPVLNPDRGNIPEPATVSAITSQSSVIDTEDNSQHNKDASNRLIELPPSGIHSRWMED